MKKLMFLMTALGLLSVFTFTVTAQKARNPKKFCSIDVPYYPEQKVTLNNNTNSVINLHFINYDTCEELSAVYTAQPGESISITEPQGRAYRIREEGTNKVLKEIIITGKNSVINIGAKSSNAESAGSGIADQLKKKMVGTWLQPGSKMVMDENEFTVYENGKILIKAAYTLNDDMLEFTGTDGNTSRRKVSFKNNNTMIWTNPAKGTSNPFTRVVKGAKPAGKTKR